MTNAQESLHAQILTWNLEVMSKCFFMSVPSTWLIEQLRTGRRSPVNALSLCIGYSLSVPNCRSRCECCSPFQSQLYHGELARIIRRPADLHQNVPRCNGLIALIKTQGFMQQCKQLSATVMAESLQCSGTNFAKHCSHWVSKPFQQHTER